MNGSRILALTTDSFGGRGGIASYARDTIKTMAGRSDVSEVVVLTSLMPDDPSPLPAGVRLVDMSRTGKLGYAAEAARLALTDKYDAVWVAHAALAPLGWLAARRSRTKLGMSLHGSEVWQRGRGSREWAMARADLLMPVSRVTLDRYRAARGGDGRAFAILPGTVDLQRFEPGPRPTRLVGRYGLGGRRVMLTVSRIGEDLVEKGFARLIVQLPQLVERWPDLVYLIGGDGSQRDRLERQIRDAGLRDRVIITGYIDEAELADHYRLADAFILPSSGEGLGIVLLEAQACGIPTIASALDGGAEAVARTGWAVDPNDGVAVQKALAEAFASIRRRPPGIEHFAIGAFEKRMNLAIDRLFD